VHFRNINRRRRALLALEGVIRTKLEAEGFVLCADHCGAHKTCWCIRVRDPGIDRQQASYDAMQGDVARILFGVYAGCVDQISIEICRRVPAEDDVLCHILLKCRR